MKIKNCLLGDALYDRFDEVVENELMCMYHAKFTIAANHHNGS